MNNISDMLKNLSAHIDNFGPMVSSLKEHFVGPGKDKFIGDLVHCCENENNALDEYIQKNPVPVPSASKSR